MAVGATLTQGVLQQQSVNLNEQNTLKQFEYKTNEKGEIELETGEKLSGVKAERYK